MKSCDNWKRQHVVAHPTSTFPSLLSVNGCSFDKTLRVFGKSGELYQSWMHNRNALRIYSVQSFPLRISKETMMSFHFLVENTALTIGSFSHTKLVGVLGIEVTT